MFKSIEIKENSVITRPYLFWFIIGLMTLPLLFMSIFLSINDGDITPILASTAFFAIALLLCIHGLGHFIIDFKKKTIIYNSILRKKEYRFESLYTIEKLGCTYCALFDEYGKGLTLTFNNSRFEKEVIPLFTEYFSNRTQPIHESQNIHQNFSKYKFYKIDGNRYQHSRGKPTPFFILPIGILMLGATHYSDIENLNLLLYLYGGILTIIGFIGIFDRKREYFDIEKKAYVVQTSKATHYYHFDCFVGFKTTRYIRKHSSFKTKIFIKFEVDNKIHEFALIDCTSNQKKIELLIQETQSILNK